MKALSLCRFVTTPYYGHYGSPNPPHRLFLGTNLSKSYAPQILDYMETKQSATLSDICAEVLPQSQPSSVYRCLKMMVERGFLIKTETFYHLGSERPEPSQLVIPPGPKPGTKYFQLTPNLTTDENLKFFASLVKGKGGFDELKEPAIGDLYVQFMYHLYFLLKKANILEQQEWWPRLKAFAEVTE